MSSQSNQAASETPSVHKDAPSQKRSFPRSLFPEILPTLGGYKDKPLTSRLEHFASRILGQESWDQVSEFLDLGSLTPVRCLKLCGKVLLVVTGILLLVNWRYRALTSTEDSQRQALIRNLAVLHPNYKGPVFFHLLAYQKTGANFIAKMFDLYPDVFYIHDPIQMVYTSVFGVPPDSDRVLPTNIFFDSQGEYRNLSQVEHGLDLWTMDKIYHCRMSDLPTSMLVNPYWSTHASSRMLSALPYVNCLEKHGVRMDIGHEAFRECQAYIREPVCPSNFQTRSGFGRCGRVLFSNGTFTTQDSDALWEPGNPMSEHRDNFKMYFQCLARLSPAAKKCAQWHLDGPCSKKKFRVVKTVRVSMWMAEKFLKVFPNYRVVHLFRDPRGVTYSRLQSASPLAFASFEKPDAKSLARSYCSQLYMDKVARIRLQHVYYDRVIGLFYDKFVRNITTNVDLLVKNLNFKLSKAKSSVEFATRAIPYAQTQKDKWRYGMDSSAVKQVQQVCQKLLRNLQLCFSGMRCIEYSLED